MDRHSEQAALVEVRLSAYQSEVIEDPKDE
jgi:hypothetical protein